MVHFREVQRFRQRWLWLILLVPVLLCGYGLYQQLILGRPFGNHPTSDDTLIAISLLVLLLPAWLYNVCLITEVRDDALDLRFFLLWKRKRIRFQEIATFRATTYRPIVDYGGWGVRWGPGGRAFNVSGNRGVQLELVGGRRLLIGSQRPDELARAIAERKQLTQL